MPQPQRDDDVGQVEPRGVQGAQQQGQRDADDGEKSEQHQEGPEQQNHGADGQHAQRKSPELAHGIAGQQREEADERHARQQRGQEQVAMPGEARPDRHFRQNGLHLPNGAGD